MANYVQMHKLVWWPLWLLLVLGGRLEAQVLTAHAADVSRPLTIGILPYQAPATMFKHFAVLTDYLERHVGQRFVLETAPDYSEFVHRTAQRRYDILITAPHFALLAHDSGHYQVQAAYITPLKAVIVVPETSPITHLHDLAGIPVSTPPNSAIITLVGRHYLAQQGLTEEWSPVYQAYPSHDASNQAALGGLTSASVASVNVYRIAKRNGAPLRVIGESPEIPGMAILIAKDLPSPIQHDIISEIVTMRETPEGRAALQRMAYPGYRRANAEEFEPARNFLDDLAGERRTSAANHDTP